MGLVRLFLLAVAVWCFGADEVWIKASHLGQWTWERYKEGGDLKSDVYLRRMRLVLCGGAGSFSWKVDLRNDNIGYRDNGTGAFKAGEVYGRIGYGPGDLRFYRPRIDVSRTQSISAKRLVHYDRPKVSDAAAQFVSRDRRNDNIQINLQKGPWRLQSAVGKGPEAQKFTDAAGHTLKGSLSQDSPCYGAKVRYALGDARRTETYFGKGRHFELGVAYWLSPDILYRPQDADSRYSTDHHLLNVELSAHKGSIFLQGEYFYFDGVVKDFLAEPGTTGSSWGWYALAEYYDASGLAPFLRIERWERFAQDAGYRYSSDMGGLHYYIRKNRLKVGLVYELSRYGERIGDKDVRSYKLTTQWAF